MATFLYKHIAPFWIIMLSMMALSFESQAQKVVLTEIDGGGEQIIHRGYKILYKLEGKPLTHSRLKRIEGDHLITKVDTFLLEELDFIGYTPPMRDILRLGAQIWHYASYATLTLAFLAYTNIPDVPQIGNALAVMGFVPLIISRRIYASNEFRICDLEFKWSAEIE